MKRIEFDELVKKLKKAGITKEEIEYLYVTLGIEDEEDVKTKTIESFLTLASTNMELVKKYGIYIDEYYKLPITNRQNVCKTAYKDFIKNGNLSIENLSTFIVNEVESMEESVDPVVEAIRESNKLLQKNPKINTNGVRYE